MGHFIAKVYLEMKLFAYTDDIALITRRLPDLKKFFIQLARAAKEVGLEVKIPTPCARRRTRHIRRVQFRACEFLQPSGKTCDGDK